MQLSKFAPLTLEVLNFITLHKWTCVRALLGHVVPVAIPTNCPSPYPQPEPTTALILTLSPSPEPTTAMMFLLCTGRVHSFLNTRLCVCVCVCVCARARVWLQLLRRKGWVQVGPSTSFGVRVCLGGSVCPACRCFQANRNRAKVAPADVCTRNQCLGIDCSSRPEHLSRSKKKN